MTLDGMPPPLLNKPADERLRLIFRARGLRPAQFPAVPLSTARLPSWRGRQDDWIASPRKGSTARVEWMKVSGKIQCLLHGATLVSALEPAMSNVTHILNAIERGESSAERLLPLVYEELRKLASAKMSSEAAGHTLQPTALVHEAWLRLAGDDGSAPFANRAHFFAAAAEAMRRILIESARRKGRHKRGQGAQRVDLDELDLAAAADSDTLLLVNESLEKLEREDPRAAELVKLRFFGGLTLEEAGQVLGFTERTAKRCWSFARAWLFNDMGQELKE
jgi:RNA polymerase sigma factor (TIGR02999 family)